MIKVIIMRGLPGSGKSTLARAYFDEYVARCYDDGVFANCVILSTDDYWHLETGLYNWVAKEVPQAHAWNFGRFCMAMEAEYGLIIIDNTNTMAKEARKYVQYVNKRNSVKAKFDWRLNCKVEVAEPQTPWAFNLDELVKKNTHNVPRESIQAMLTRWEDTETFKKNLGI